MSQCIFWLEVPPSGVPTSSRAEKIKQSDEELTKALTAGHKVISSVYCGDTYKVLVITDGGPAVINVERSAGAKPGPTALQQKLKGELIGWCVAQHLEKDLQLVVHLSEAQISVGCSYRAGRDMCLVLLVKCSELQQQLGEGNTGLYYSPSESDKLFADLCELVSPVELKFHSADLAEICPDLRSMIAMLSPEPEKAPTTTVRERQIAGVSTLVWKDASAEVPQRGVPVLVHRNLPHSNSHPHIVDVLSFERVEDSAEDILGFWWRGERAAGHCKAGDLWAHQPNVAVDCSLKKEG
jgi:hypothetical protein